MVERLDQGAIPPEVCPRSYSALHRLVARALFRAHVEGKLKAEIIQVCVWGGGGGGGARRRARCRHALVSASPTSPPPASTLPPPTHTRRTPPPTWSLTPAWRAPCWTSASLGASCCSSPTLTTPTPRPSWPLPLIASSPQAWPGETCSTWWVQGWRAGWGWGVCWALAAAARGVRLMPCKDSRVNPAPPSPPPPPPPTRLRSSSTRASPTFSLPMVPCTKLSPPTASCAQPTRCAPGGCTAAARRPW